MGRALAPLSEEIPRIRAESERARAFEAAVEAARDRPEVAERLGRSWRLFDAPAETHLANALEGVEVDDPLWALQQAIREQRAAEDFGVSVPLSERQQAQADAVLGTGQER